MYTDTVFTRNFYRREKQRKQTNKYQITIARPKQPPKTYILLISETNYGKYRKKILKNNGKTFIWFSYFNRLF